VIVRAHSDVPAVATPSTAAVRWSDTDERRMAAQLLGDHSASFTLEPFH